MKYLKDYLHLYNNRFSPVKVIVDNDEQKYLWDIEVYDEDYVNITLGDTKLRDMEGNSDNWNVYNDNHLLSRIKPILRPLSDMTEEEFLVIKPGLSPNVTHAFSLPATYHDKPWHVLILENRLQTNTLTFNDGMILLRQHFDLFGLIDAGLAIDKTKQ